MNFSQASASQPAFFQPFPAAAAPNFSHTPTGFIAPSDPFHLPQSRSASLLFIDQSVPDYQILAAAAVPGTEIHLLNSAQDAISQITQTLLGRTGISSLSIVSHGAPGNLEFGQSWLNAAGLQSHASQIQSWSQSLTKNADILLYGCDVAQGSQGEQFVNLLSQLSGAAVAASTNVTGNPAEHGDWTLEFHTGEIEATLPFQATGLQAYHDTLGGVVINEFRRAGNLSNTEYIEFLLTADQTAAQLESLYFGDSTTATNGKYGIYRFTNLAAIAPTFKKGTLIAIGGSTAIATDDVTYNPTVGGTDDAWNLKLQVSGPYVTWSSNPNLGDLAASDVVWVDSSNTGITSIDSIVWGSPVGAFGAAAKVTLTTAPSDGTTGIVEFRGDATQSRAPSQYAIDSAGSLGLPNGSINSAYISSLRNLTPFGNDFDGNGTNDAVWYNYQTGALQIWLMQGNTYQSTVNLGTMGAGWQLMDVADFNGDGKSDLLWRNQVNGQTGLWLMNGTTIQSTVDLGTVDSDWKIAGVVDFDRNGSLDLIWQSQSQGAAGVWLMQGTTMMSTVALPAAPSKDWTLVGTKDMNNDGQIDLLWRNRYSGEASLWLMNGTSIASTSALPTLPNQWVIYGTGDFNNDNSPDILIRNITNGQTAIWSMNNGVYGSTQPLTLPNNAPGWMILDYRDVDGNGTPDLIVRNYITNQDEIWLMNGTTSTATATLPNITGFWDTVA